MALPRALAAFLLLGSLFHTARADTLVTSGTYTWTSASVGQMEVTVRVYRDVTGYPGLLKWDYEIHNISMHNYYDPCGPPAAPAEGIGEFWLPFSGGISPAELEANLVLPEGWEYYPTYNEDYSAIVGLDIGATDWSYLVLSGGSVHLTFTTQPRAGVVSSDGAGSVPWIGCAERIRGLGKRRPTAANPTVKAAGGTRLLDLAENWAGGSILAPEC